jgi:hypothetical protein
LALLDITMTLLICHGANRFLENASKMDLPKNPVPPITSNVFTLTITF